MNQVVKKQFLYLTLSCLVFSLSIVLVVGCREFRPEQPPPLQDPPVKTHPNKSGMPRWVFPPVGKKIERIVSTPKLGNGVVIITTLDYKVYAVGYNGKKRWTYQTGGIVLASAATGLDGTVYVGSRDQYLYAISSNGRRRWRYRTDGVIDSSPYVDSSTFSDHGEVIYIASHDGNLYAITKDKKELWRFNAKAPFKSSTPATSDDGTIFIGSQNGVLHAINPKAKADAEGNIPSKWSKKICDKITSSPTVEPISGIVFIGCWDGRLQAINSDQSIKWTFKTKKRRPILASPLLSADAKTLYVGSDDTFFYALNVSDGKILWSFQSGDYSKKTGKYKRTLRTEAYFQAKACLGSDGRVYVGSVNQYLYSLHPKSGRLLWQFDMQGWVTNAPVRKTHQRSKDVIYVPAGRRLYAVNP